MEWGADDASGSASVTAVEADESDPVQRRIRHITSIQIRNLTPFPVRDAFASALAQQTDPPQPTSSTGAFDDLDVALARKRSRRISATSVNTLRSARVDDAEDASSSGRRRTASRVSFHDNANAVSGSPSSVKRAGTIRPAGRKRTNSTTSSLSVKATSASVSVSPAPTVPIGATSSSAFSTLFPDNSQKSLEKVIHSRLVETFVELTIEPPAHDPDLAHAAPSGCNPEVPQSSTLARLKSASAYPREMLNGATSLSTAKRTSSPVKDGPRSPSPVLSPTRYSLAKSSSANGTSATGRPRTPTQAKSSPSLAAFPKSSTRLPPAKQASTPPQTPSPPPSNAPDYLSPIHRPSTNPSFSLDSRDFLDGTDLSGRRMHVAVWGRLGDGAHDLRQMVDRKGKRKAAEKEGEGDGLEWKVLQEWDLDLGELLPLPESHAARATLPSNTLLVTLSPPGHTLYLPTPPPISASSRSRSPSPGHASDPETTSALRLPPLLSGFGSKRAITFVRRRRKVEEEGVKGAGWQDLLKLVTLQANVVDTEESLAEIMKDIDKSLQGTEANHLKREALEREARIERTREERRIVREQSSLLQSEIEARRERLRQRRETLQLASEYHEQGVALEARCREEIAQQRSSLDTLRQRVPATRTTLLTTLSTIYPIDLISPPDLLFAVLDVPLPIPLTPSDPAPAPTRTVNEDAIATALGYAAQVVQLLAAYLGKGLVYPVTCVGSRSLIRDGISAMVGPRMFPLFSKGVDTYRYEYGVFLLNKDIELLMADIDLRALDMRHTLPNLKNLLLTLTDGETASLHPDRSTDSPNLSVSGLESPPRAQSPAATTPSISSTEDHASTGDSPPASGSTTPTATTSDPTSARKSRAFLSPLAGFLRARYPSATRPSTLKPSDAENGNGNGNGSVVNSGSAAPEPPVAGAEDEDDRRTLRGSGGTEGREQGEKEDVIQQPQTTAKAESNGSAVPHSESPPPSVVAPVS